MSEFMGLLYGIYDAKPDGFKAGGGSLHNCMAPHGPDKEAFENAVNQNLSPEKYTDTLAFMFESNLPWTCSKFAMDKNFLQENYYKCWENLPRTNSL